ncbi:MAG: GAF domain-containing protein, partial [Magnetococcales bacterium]|nr:GAF domain-containing protein [Magnetococcales bacterium]
MSTRIWSPCLKRSTDVTVFFENGNEPQSEKGMAVVKNRSENKAQTDSFPPPPGKAIHSIRAQMVFWLLLLFVPVLFALEFFSIIGVPFSGWNGFMGIETEQGLRQLELIADIKKDRLLRWLEERRSDAHVLAHNPTLSRHVDRLRTLWQGLKGRAVGDAAVWETLRAEDDFKEVVSALKLIREATPIYERMDIIALPAGAPLVSTQENPGMSASEGWPLNGTYLDRDGSQVRLTESARDNRPVMHIFHPMTDAKGGTVAAVVLTVDGEATIAPMLHSGEGLGEQDEAFLFDHTLEIFTSLKHPLPDGSQAQPLHYRLRTRSAGLATSAAEGIVGDLDYRGQKVWAAYRHLPVGARQEWGLVVQRDRESLIGSIDHEIHVAIVSSAVAVLVLILLSLWMSKRLSTPIIQLVRSAEKLSLGDLDVRTRLTERNEIGLLSQAFDRMAETMQRTLQELEEQTARLNASLHRQAQHQEVQEKVLRLSRILVSARSLEELLDKGLDIMMLDTDSQVGAIYLRDEDDENRFSLVRSAGMSCAVGVPATIGVGEGAMGLAIRRKCLQVVTDISPETEFIHPTIAGSGIPKTLVHLPLVFQERVLGVLALASLRRVSDQAMEILEMGQSLVSMALADAIAHAKTERMAHKLRLSNEELEANNQELQAQSLQLRAQTEELQSQTEELKYQAKELEIKQGQVEKAD